jgi:hypothetical protein
MGHAGASPFLVWRDKEPKGQLARWAKREEDKRISEANQAKGQFDNGRAKGQGKNDKRLNISANCLDNSTNSLHVTCCPRSWFTLDKRINIQLCNSTTMVAAVTGMQRIPVVLHPKTQAIFATTLIANAPP